MIAIIDYGMGNVGSVKNALDALGYDAVISAGPGDIAAASHLILPGVGAFGDAMENIRSSGLVPILEQEVLERKKPFLGLCLGMQMLADTGEEGGLHQGLGWISGRVARLGRNSGDIRVPHVGWNDVAPRRAAKLFHGVRRPIFYFVHSFYVVPDDASVVAGETDYGVRFASAVEKENIFGLQFHPEKSQREGLKVLENFLSL